MKALYVIGGMVCFMCAFANAYAFCTSDKKLAMRAMDMIAFGACTFCAVYCTVEAAMA